ncbi:MAG: hypothetical protein CMM53_11060 [Rhodospirillaceae bacterium]|nr:hypothetical protein [Rhodospirillaceae bacterium]
MQTIDTSAHVIETDKTWCYLAGNERHFAPVVPHKTDEKPSTNNQFWLSGDKVKPKDNADTLSKGRSSCNMSCVDARLKNMDELNIDVQVLYPTIFFVLRK